MNRFAYYMSGYAFKALAGISKAKINIHGDDKIPIGKGSCIFTANHFTRIETLFLPYHIHQITNKPVWSLAAAELFQGGLKRVLEAMGAVSTRDPQRDFLIVKSLINGQADCVIFPEGMMVKNKKITSDGDFRLYQDGQIDRPRTGAATLALQTEFYRERLRRMIKIGSKEFDRLIEEYQIKSPKEVMEQETFIIPVNITYYPVRAKDNVLSRMALNMIETPSKRVMDELLTEGTMIFSGVDVDIRFGEPICIRSDESMVVKADISTDSSHSCSMCEKEQERLSAHPKDYFFNSFIESDLSSRRKINFSNRLSSYHVMKANANEIMNRYMKSVYEMTTLNYDHIFASILKYMNNRGQRYLSSSQKYISNSDEGFNRADINQDGIDQYDFRCRAFLATFACEMSLHCNFHNSLYSNQIHILTNDRFHRYKEFIQLAIETGVVEEKDGRLYRNNEKLGGNDIDSLQYDFHTVRVENPIAVIANEVEPLAKLQAYFADLAMKSNHEIALLMSYRIEDKQYNSYLNDFSQYVGPLPLPGPLHDAGIYMEEEIVESEILSVRHRPFIRKYSVSESQMELYNNGRPHLLKSNDSGEQGDTGVLLVHDYLSCPGEMIPFARALHSNGFTVYLPRLPGHGTAPENLTASETMIKSEIATAPAKLISPQNITASSNMKGKLFVKWIEAVEEGFVLLRSLCRKIVVGGLGIGGIFGLVLQSRVTDVDAIFMVAPPQRIKDYPNEFLTSGGLWSQMIKRAGLQGGEKDEWIIYLPEIPEFRYSTHPVSALRQVEMLLEHVDGQIKEMEKGRDKQRDAKKDTHKGQTGIKTSKPLGVKYLSEKYCAMFKPFLLVQSRNNQFVNPNGAQKLFEMLPATLKEYYIFDSNRHVILRGKERDRIADAIISFIKSVVGS